MYRFLRQHHARVPIDVDILAQSVHDEYLEPIFAQAANRLHAVLHDVFALVQR